jgi:hypothetical protein
MQLFVDTLSSVGGVVTAMVGGVVVLTLFYRGLAWLSADGEKPNTIALRGVLKRDTLATVHLAGGQKFERVRFVGFTNSEALKTHLPFELNGMVILEDEQKLMYLVRARNIQMIVIAPTPAPTSA